MSIIRFNHVFIGLMAASGFCSFVLPPAASGKFKGRVDGLFAPVAFPIRKIAGGISRQFNKAPTVAFDIADAPVEARLEIERLRGQVASLTIQIDGLKQLSAGRELVGDAHRYAVPIKVIGNDPGGRDALILAGSTANGLDRNQAVVRRDTLIGRISHATPGGATVRLITDRGMSVNASFGRFRQTKDGKAVEFVPIAGLLPLVEGKGNGTMTVSSLTLEQVKAAGVTAGDYVALKDPEEWPLLVNGYLIGQVDSIRPSSKAPLYAEITVKPRQNLMQLSEVMVVTQTMAAPAGPQQTPIRPMPVNNPVNNAANNTATRRR